MNFKFRDKDSKLLSKEVKRFNAKIKRMMKNPKYEGVKLPSLVTVKGIKSELTSRNEFNKAIKSLNRLFKKNAMNVKENTHGVKITQYEKLEIGYKVRAINTKRKKMHDELARTLTIVDGVESGLTRGEMRDERLVDLLPKKYDIDKIKTAREWEKYVESVEKQASHNYYDGLNNQFKANYLQAISDNLGAYADDLIEIVERFTGEQLYNLSIKYQELSISFYYDPIEQYARAETARTILLEEMEYLDLEELGD